MIGKTTICMAMLIAATALNGISQYMENPSFEDPPGINTVPDGWRTSNSSTTPDIGPFSCDQNMLTASHGDSYLILTTRDENASFPGSVEALSTTLTSPLEPGYYYTFSADLATSSEVGYFTWQNGYVAYDQPVSMKAWWGTYGNERAGVILETDLITGTSWKTLSAMILPDQTVTSITLELINSEPVANGNICIDNLQITLDSVYVEPEEETEVFIPNVFTPNSDGTNDVFEITGLKKPTALMIFHENGHPVFRSDDYENNWDGKGDDGNLLPEGQYWYVIIEPGFGKPRKGYVYLKRK